nr:hypothetical protein [Tanacetum cinerariifolium]
MGLEAYNGEINLRVEENMISNDNAVKLCLEHEVKRGNKVVKKKLIVTLRGEIYFVKFIINLEEDDVEPGVILGRTLHRMTKAITDFGAGTVTIYPEFDLFLEDIKEEEKSEALKEKDDPEAFIFTIRLEGKVNENALANTRSDINTMPYQIYETLGREEMKKVGVTTIIANFLILDIPIDRDAPIVVGQGFITTESDSDDEEKYQIKRNKFGAPIYGPKPAPYLNCNDLAKRSLALQAVINLFWNISVWKKAVSFLGSLLVPLKQVNWKPEYKGYYTKEEEATRQWCTEIRLTDPYGNINLQGLWGKMMMRPDHQDPNALDNLKLQKKCCFYKFTMSSCYGKVVVGMRSLEIDDMLRIRLREAGSNEEIFTSIAWIRAFNINEPIYVELCHELVLYQAVRLDEEGFNVFFEGGLRSDEHFNAHEYWLSISREDDLGLSRSHTSTIKSLILRVIHKMITYGLCQRTNGWMKRKGAGTQKESQICCGQFITKTPRKLKVLTDDVIRSLSASIYCSDLDTTTLRDLIDFKGRLILEDPQQGVPRVGIPRPPRASMQDLYDRMGRMEIRQEAIEQMEYRQLYHWDREPTTHLVMLSRSMIGIIKSTHLHHHSSNNNRMMISSVERI